MRTRLSVRFRLSIVSLCSFISVELVLGSLVGSQNQIECIDIRNRGLCLVELKPSYYRMISMQCSDSETKTYEVKQVDRDGDLLASVRIDAESGEAAAKQLKQVVDGTQNIQICLDGNVMNEMGVNYWRTRIRRR